MEAVNDQLTSYTDTIFTVPRYATQFGIQ